MPPESPQYIVAVSFISLPNDRAPMELALGIEEAGHLLIRQPRIIQLIIDQVFEGPFGSPAVEVYSKVAAEDFGDVSLQDRLWGLVAIGATFHRVFHDN